MSNSRPNLTASKVQLASTITAPIKDVTSRNIPIEKNELLSPEKGVKASAQKKQNPIGSTVARVATAAAEIDKSLNASKRKIDAVVKSKTASNSSSFLFPQQEAQGARGKKFKLKRSLEDSAESDSLLQFDIPIIERHIESDEDESVDHRSVTDMSVVSLLSSGMVIGSELLDDTLDEVHKSIKETEEAVRSLAASETDIVATLATSAAETVTKKVVDKTRNLNDAMDKAKAALQQSEVALVQDTTVYTIAPLKKRTQPDAPENDLDRMKVETMNGLMNDVMITLDGKLSQKKVMYMTNTQAELFDDATMLRCFPALNIGEPKFVIFLIPTAGLIDIKNTKDNDIYKDLASDAEQVRAQILLFMKTCILPIAMQTRALILVSGATSCVLATALSQVAVAEQARLGEDCPFKVVAMVSEWEVHGTAHNPAAKNSIAYQIAQGSTEWNSKIDKLQDAYYVSQKLLKNKSKKSLECDLISGASTYLLFEEIEGSLGEEDVRLCNLPKRSFESIMLKLMTKRYPCIAIECCGRQLESVSDLASRNVPILLLDTTKRVISYDQVLTGSTSTLLMSQKPSAFPLIARDTVLKLQLQKNNQGLTLDGRKEILSLAKKMALLAIREKRVDCYESSLYAFFHSALHLGSDMASMTTTDSKHQTHKTLYEKLQLKKSENANGKSATKIPVPYELAAEAIEFLRANDAERIKVLNSFYEGVEPLSSSEDEHNKDLKSDQQDDDWLGLFDIFTRPFIYSSSIHDVESIKRIISDVARIDRLPEENSFEALRALQDAWDHVEIYHSHADYYKQVTKVSYYIMAGLAIAVTILSLLGSTNQINSEKPLIIVSFATTFVVAMVTFLNPAIRWQSLRMGALSIESNIFTFRARAGAYRVDVTDSNSVAASDEMLSDSITEVKTVVFEGADIKGTDFYSRNKVLNKHNQHSKGMKGGAFGLPEKPIRRFLDCFNCCFRSSKQDLYQTNDPKKGSQDKSSVIESEMSVDIDEVMDENAVEPSDDLEMNIFAEEKKPSLDTSILSRLQPEERQKEPFYRLDEIIHLIRHKMHSSSMIDKSKKMKSKLSPHVPHVAHGDNFYDPLTPEMYIRYRLQPMLQFYTTRIPYCYQTRFASQVCLIFGAVLIGALAYFQMDTWTAAVTIVTSSISAYLEFHGTERKINRYSFTIHSLRNLIHWWETLPPIDRSVVENIDRLVLTGEDLLQKEQQAWKSTSQAMKMLQKANKDKEKDKDKDGKDKAE